MNSKGTVCKYDLLPALDKLVCGHDAKRVMKEVSEAVYWAVYNTNHPTELSEATCEEVTLLGRHLALLINDGFIYKLPQVMKYLQKHWMNKYGPEIFREIE